MKAKETAVNTLIGLTLLLAFILPFVALISASVLARRVLELAAKHFFPTIAHPMENFICGVVILGLLAACARQLCKRLWRNAFLSSTAAAAILLPWLLLRQDPLSGLPTGWFVAVIVLFYSHLPSKAEFIAGASIIAAAFAVKAGLLGSGFLSSVVGVCAMSAMIAWIVILTRPDWARRGSILSLTVNRPTPSSPS